jgi:hypothetical protein
MFLRADDGQLWPKTVVSTQDEYCINVLTIKSEKCICLFALTVINVVLLMNACGMLKYIVN